MLEEADELVDSSQLARADVDAQVVGAQMRLDDGPTGRQPMRPRQADVPLDADRVKKRVAPVPRNGIKTR